MPYSDPEKQKEYQRQWAAKRRAVWMSDKKCVNCGSRENLEVDHIDPSKKFTHRIWSYSDKRREEELAKCQVLCKKHHKEKSLSELPQTDHGRGRMYQLGCRCWPCKAWKSNECKQYKERRKRKVNSSGTGRALKALGIG